MIVNVSSTAGKRPSTGMPDYSVTKAAVLSLSRLVADLYAGDGIRCNAITPGPTATEAWLGDGGLADQQARRGGKSREEVLEAVGKGRPLGRLAEPEEIAAVIAFLCSDRAVVRDRRGLGRGRRHRADHHLSLRPLGGAQNGTDPARRRHGHGKRFSIASTAREAGSNPTQLKGGGVGSSGAARGAAARLTG